MNEFLTTPVAARRPEVDALHGRVVDLYRVGDDMVGRVDHDPLLAAGDGDALITQYGAAVSWIPLPPPDGVVSTAAREPVRVIGGALDVPPVVILKFPPE